MLDYAHSAYKKLRRLSALALMLALLAPTLISIMPSPALSAVQQLQLDMVHNICSQNQSGGEHPQSQEDHMKCCVLCVAQHHVFLSNAPTVPATVALAISSNLLNQRYVIAFPRAPPDLRASAPRGPPNSLSI
jgi:Protein of unknown function (DUF2946)